MTNSSDERISALIDGELDEQTRQSMVDELLKKGEARATWARYHLISDTLRQNLPAGMDTQFSSRVMAALQDEPTVLAPRPPQGLQLGKRLAGLAVAASVAAVAVMGVQLMVQEDGHAPLGQVAQVPTNLSPSVAATNQALARAAMTSNIQTVTQSMNSNPLSQQLDQQQLSQLAKRIHPNLNKYLVDHNQQSAQMAVQGVMPYARIVAHPDAHYIVIPAQK